MPERDAPKAAMIFAAGFGTRMGPLTQDRPKPLISVAGRPLLDQTMDLVWPEVERITVNAHYLSEQVVAHLKGREDVTVCVEKPAILDTGGGLKAALPTLGSGPVFTLNPDVVWTGPNPLAQLRQDWAPDKMQALLLLVPAASALGRKGGGDFAMDTDGRLTRGGEWVYSGAQITQTGALARIPDSVFSLNRLWDAQIASGTLFGTVHQGSWCDVGYPEAIPLAEELLANE